MGLKRYLRLIKSKETTSKVKTHYLINLAICAMQFVFIFLYFFIEKNSAISFICGLIFVVFALVYIVSSRIFMKNLMRMVESEQLDLEVKSDLAIDLYRIAFLDFIDTKKIFAKIINKIEFVLGLLIFAAFGVMCVIGLTGNITFIETFEPIFVSATVIIFVLMIIIPAFVISFNGSWWESELNEEIAIIDEFKSTLVGKKHYRKYKILEDISPAEQNKFLFPTKELRENADKAANLSKKCTGAVITLTFVAAFISGILSATLDWNLGFMFGGIVLATIAYAAVVAYKTSSRIKTQYKILKLNEDIYPKQIKLHEIRKEHYKKWNVVFVVGALAIILLPVIIGTILQLLSISEDVMSIVCLVCWVGGFIALFWSWGRAFGHIRLEMREIEKEIEKEMKIETGALF